MSKPVAPQAATPKKKVLMISLLAGVLILYVVIQPWLRKMSAETAEIERRVAIKEAESKRLQAQKEKLKDLEAKVASSPEDWQAQIDLGHQFLALGRSDDAIRRAEIAIGLKPNIPEPMLLLGNALREKKQYVEARKTYQTLLNRFPSEPRAVVALASLYLSVGWTKEAGKLLEPALNANPDSLELKVATAMYAVQATDYGKAEILLEEVRAADPKRSELWIPLMDVYYSTKQYDKAINIGRVALALQPYSEALPTELAKSYTAQKKYREAETLLFQSLAINKDNINALYRLGLLYHQAERVEEALRVLEMSYAIDQNFENQKLILGQLYIKVGKSEKGNQLLQEARSTEGVMQARNRAMLRLSQTETKSNDHLEMAKIYQQEKNLQYARLELQRALELEPSNKQAKALQAEIANLTASSGKP